jgi:hypothetical protein
VRKSKFFKRLSRKGGALSTLVLSTSQGTPAAFMYGLPRRVISAHRL